MLLWASFISLSDKSGFRSIKTSLEWNFFSSVLFLCGDALFTNRSLSILDKGATFTSSIDKLASILITIGLFGDWVAFGDASVLASPLLHEHTNFGESIDFSFDNIFTLTLSLYVDRRLPCKFLLR